MILNEICVMVNNDNMSNVRRHAMTMITYFRIIIINTITLLRHQHPVLSFRGNVNKTIKFRGIELHEECIVIKCLFHIIRIDYAAVFRFFLYHAIFVLHLSLSIITFTNAWKWIIRAAWSTIDWGNVWTTGNLYTVNYQMHVFSTNFLA